MSEMEARISRLSKGMHKALAQTTAVIDDMGDAAADDLFCQRLPGFLAEVGPSLACVRAIKKGKWG